MSQLETAAQPLLVPLMSDDRARLDSLSAADSLVLARWAAKTCYTLNASANFNLKIAPRHARELRRRRDRLPWRVVVVAHLHDNSEPFYWLQHSTWVYCHADDAEPDDAFRAEVQRGSYKIALQIGRLLLMTMYCHLQGWEYALWWGIHYPLWPRRGPVGWYKKPISDFPSRDSARAVAMFSYSAELVDPRAIATEGIEEVINRANE